MKASKAILRNVLSNWVGYVISVIVVFFLSPFVVHTLGNTGYGIWVLVGSLTGYLGILDFGMRPAIVKFVSRFHALGDHSGVNAVINTTLLVFSIIGGLVVVAAVVVAFFADNLFEVPAEYHGELFVAIILVGLNVALSFPFGVFGATLNALQRFDLGNLIQVSVFLLRSLLILIFLKLGGGLIALSIIVLFAGLTEFLLKTISCRRILPTLVIALRLSDKSTLKQITSFSIYTFIISIALRLVFQTDSIVIGSMISAEAITYFAIANTMMDYLAGLVSQVTVTLTPVASSFEAKKDYDQLRKLLILGTKYCLLIILPIGSVFIIMGRTFISLWMGPEYAQTSGTILMILMFSCFGYLAQFTAGSVFYALGTVKKLAFVVLGTAVCKIVLSVLLVKPFGLVGVAFGTAVPLFAYGTIFQPVYVCRLTHLSLFTFIRKSYVPALLSVAPFSLLILAFRYLMTFDNLLTFAAMTGAAFLIYLVICFLVAVEPNHREELTLKVNSVLSKLKL